MRRRVARVQQLHLLDGEVERGPRLLIGLLHAREQLLSEGGRHQEDPGVQLPGLDQSGSIRCKHNVRWQHLSQMKNVANV